MNSNVLISTALLSSLWECNKKDALDIMIPFLKYSIAKTTPKGHVVNQELLINTLKEEFGYDSIPQNVICGILNRLSPSILRKSNGQYTLIVSLDDELVKFEKKKSLFKDHRNIVGNALASYLNLNISDKKRSNYEAEDALSALINFFSENGLILSQSPTRLSLIPMGKKRDIDSKLNYYIARFLLQEHENESVVFDYISDMVKGFYVSTAISFQSDNNASAHAKFKNLHCYLDTRVIIDALGMHLPTSQKGALELLDMLKSEQAILCCFDHTVEEIRTIILAYKHHLERPRVKGNCKVNNTYYPYNTLENWDSLHYTLTDVDRFLAILNEKIEKLGITIVPSFKNRKPTVKGLHYKLFQEQLRTDVRYNSNQARDNDILSVYNIMRLRRGNTSTILEKCEHIFVTTNLPLTTIVYNNLVGTAANSIPPVILDYTLSSIVWFKCSQSHQNYPKIKLVENAMLALEPSHSLLVEFFKTIDIMNAEGGLTNDEAEIIRSDIQLRRELVNITQGDSKLVSSDFIRDAQARLKAKYIADESAIAESHYHDYCMEKKKREEALEKIIQQIENAGKSQYQKTSKRLTIIARFLLIFIFLILLAFTVIIFIYDSILWVGTVLMLIVDIGGLYDMIFSKEPQIRKYIEKSATKSAQKARDAKREENAEIISSLTE